MGMSDETTERCKRYDNGGSSQCLATNNPPQTRNLTLPWSLSRAHYNQVRHGNILKPYFSGEEVFTAITESIKHAEKSIDIVAWGFDPAMPIDRSNSIYQQSFTPPPRTHHLKPTNFHRNSPFNVGPLPPAHTHPEPSYSPWRREDTYGEILLNALKEHKDLRIRIVLWYCRVLGVGFNTGDNIVGLASSFIAGSPEKLVSINTRKEKDTGFDPRFLPKRPTVRSRHPDAQSYSKQWFDFIQNAKTADHPYLDRLAFCFRSIDSTPLIEEDPPLGAESQVYALAPSDHQKTILIDFDDPDKRHGYLMGHNGLTPYWSHFPFVHRDVRNEMDFAPYHDFSMYVRGPLLIDMNENFCDAWQSRFTFKGTGFFGSFATHQQRTLESEDAQALRAQRQEHYCDMLAATALGPASAQIVRTMPTHIHDGAQEKDIKDLYLFNTRHATNYILIVNQYCQYAKLIRHIKYWWNQRRQSGLDKKLYIFMGTCKPERDGQVFRAQQMANELGVGLQFPVATDNMYYDDNDPRRARQERAEERATEHNGFSPHPTWKPNGDRTTRGAIMGAAEHKIPRSELESMGIYPLFFMFYTQIPTERQRGDTPTVNDVAQQVYVHAKLMVMDDIFTTLGSANLNTRSMAVDSEINLATNDLATAQNFRKTLWTAYSGIKEPSEIFPNHEGILQPNEIEFIYNKLTVITDDNYEKVKEGHLIKGLIAKFEDVRSVCAIRVG